MTRDEIIQAFQKVKDEDPKTFFNAMGYGDDGVDIMNPFIGDSYALGLVAGAMYALQHFIPLVQLSYDGTPYTEKVETPHAHGPRGEYYDYALLLNGRVIAIGDEQGNYSGGIIASALSNRDALLSRLKKEYKDGFLKGLQPVSKDFIEGVVTVKLKDLAWIFPWINGGRKTYAALPECTQKDLVEIDEKFKEAAIICQKENPGLAAWLRSVRREAAESFKLAIVTREDLENIRHAHALKTTDKHYDK